MGCAVGGSEEVICSCARAAYWDYNVTRHTRNAILRGIQRRDIEKERQRERSAINIGDNQIGGAESSLLH
jgi:hypothetical protein